MISNHPYLIRAINDWLLDSQCTPHLLVNAEAPNGLDRNLDGVDHGARRDRSARKLVEFAAVLFHRPVLRGGVGQGGGGLRGQPLRHQGQSARVARDLHQETRSLAGGHPGDPLRERGERLSADRPGGARRVGGARARDLGRRGVGKVTTPADPTSRAGGPGHQVGGPLGLGEGDRLADALQAAEEHHHPVDPQGDPPVGRRAVLQGVQQEPEPVPGRLLVDAQQPEDLLLLLLVVDSDGAAAGLRAVDHQVVGLGAGASRFIFEQIEILGPRRRERVVQRIGRGRRRSVDADCLRRLS